MIRRLSFALVAVALVVGCKGKQSKTDAEGVPTATGVDEQGIQSTPMTFDAQGSDSGNISGLVTVNFDYDKSSLSADMKQKLQGNAAWMKSNSVNVQIEGHCDARGSIEYNIALGERRANAVKAYMVSQGVPSGRLSVISYGKEKPLSTGDSDSAYAQNRRANFVPLQ